MNKKSAAADKDAIELYRQLREYVRNGGVNLKKRFSNKTTVMESLDNEDKTENYQVV